MKVERLSFAGALVVNSLFSVIFSYLTWKEFHPWRCHSPVEFVVAQLPPLLLLLLCLPKLRLKAVRTDGENFYISDFFRRATIPCHAVKEVSFHAAARSVEVLLTFREDTPFGFDVRFMCRMDTERVATCLRKYPKSETNDSRLF